MTTDGETAGGEAPEDGHVMALFDPKPAGYVLVLGFSKLEDMLQVQEHTMGLNRKFDDDGRRLDETVETVTMGRAIVGTHELFGHFEGTLIAVTNDDKALTEQARRDWSAERSIRQGPTSAVVPLAERWAPTSEQSDWLDKWRDEVIEPHPAGENGPRVYTRNLTQGFNSFVTDHRRDDLRLSGIAGGRAVSGMVQAWFDIRPLRDASNANPHFKGIQRRPDAKPSWLPGSFK